MQPEVLLSFMIKSYCRTVYDLMFCSMYREAKKRSRCREEIEENHELHIIKSSSFLMYCKRSFAAAKLFQQFPLQ